MKAEEVRAPWVVRQVLHHHLFPLSDSVPFGSDSLASSTLTYLTVDPCPSPEASGWKMLGKAQRKGGPCVAGGRGSREANCRGC